ncbi:MAG TPA: hypothetical protein VFZ61_24715 [Polyangiales bacterium]
MPATTEIESGVSAVDAGETSDASSTPIDCEDGCRNAHGSAECVDGTCIIDCRNGFEDCDGDPSNGCETNLASDPMQCGACGRACDVERELCQDGSCQPSSCGAGRGECDDDPGRMCETDLTGSSQHCGFCGNACMVAQGTGACEARSCVVGGCSAGYADCDGDYFTGCEAMLDSSEHCGECGKVCVNPHGVAACSAGKCAPACAVGYDDCDGNPDNGCETSLDTTDHCGECGRSCAAETGASVCNAGACATRCDLTGTFALRLSLEASWSSTGALVSGNGEFVFWARLRLTQSGNMLTGTLAPCGEAVPDFRAINLVERYGVSVPDAMFDRGAGLPALPASATLTDSFPGGRFALERTAIVMGAALSDPINGAWPSANAIAARDSDADGKPGITLPYKTSGSYFYPPADNLGVTRVQAGYIATRVAFGLSGALDTCNSSSGTVSAQSIDARSLGCRTVADLRDCNAIEANHLDENTPRYQVGQARYKLHRIADNATCANVRSALP